MPSELNELTNAALFFWGSVGGFAAFLLAIALPWLNDTLQTGDFAFHRPWIGQAALVIVVIAIHAFLGGIAALIIGEGVKIGQALTYGLAAPTVLKGAGEGLQALDSARRRREERP